MPEQAPMETQVLTPAIQPVKADPGAELISDPSLAVDKSPDVKAVVTTEPKGEPEFNFDSFTNPALRAAEVKKLEVKPDEEEISIKANTEEVQHSEPDKIKEAPVEGQISEFSPEVTKLLKQMSNPAREFAVARMREVGEIKTKLAEAEKRAAELSTNATPQSYYENPNAYTLLPEYQSTVKNASIADAIAKHWENQLVKIELGEEWQDLEDAFDDKGKYLGPRLGKAMKPTAQAKVELTRHLNHASQQFQTFQQKAAYIQTNFSNGVKQVMSKVQEKEREIFNTPEWSDAKSIEYKTAEHCAKIIRDTGVTEVNPLFGTAAKLAATVLLQRQYIQALAGNAERKTAVAAIATKVGPTGVSGGAVAPVKADVTFVAFEKVLRR